MFPKQAAGALQRALRRIARRFGGGTLAPAVRARFSDDLLVRMGQAGEKVILPVIVQLTHRRELADVAAEIGAFTVKYVYESFPGFAAELLPAQLEDLAGLEYIQRIEYDGEVHALLDTSTKWCGVQKARTDFGVNGDRDPNDGGYSKADVVVAVIDTGIDTGHADLAGKVIGWNDLVGNRATPYDDNGHGTHVSSIATGAGRGNAAYTGVAPGAALVGVKVLDANGTGTLSGVAAGIDWVTSNKDNYNIRVLNLSLGAAGPADGTDAVSVAVNRAVDAGIVACVAAGNSGPAKGTVGTPAAAAKAITMGAPNAPPPEPADNSKRYLINNPRGSRGWHRAQRIPLPVE